MTPQSTDPNRAALHTQWVADTAALHPGALALLERQALASGMQAGRAWFDNFSAEVRDDGVRTGFLCVDRGGRTLAVLPMKVLPGGALESLSNYYTTLFAPALDETLTAADLQAGVQALLRAHHPATLRLAPMDPQGRPYALLRQAMQQAGLRCHPFFSFGNWYLPSAGLAWDDYWKSRTSGLRSTCKRMAKKFAADGGTLELVTGGDRLDSAIEAYHTVYASSWKQPEPYTGFMPGLIRTCAEHGWLRLGVARLNDQAVATQLWIVTPGRAEIYKVAYDEAFKAYSLGSLVTEMLMRHVLETDRVSEVDFLAGDEKYKQQWMTERRERWGLMAYNPRTVAGLVGAVREAAGRRIRPLLTRFWRPVGDGATVER